MWFICEDIQRMNGEEIQEARQMLNEQVIGEDEGSEENQGYFEIATWTESKAMFVNPVDATDMSGPTNVLHSDRLHSLHLISTGGDEILFEGYTTIRETQRRHEYRDDEIAAHLPSIWDYCAAAHNKYVPLSKSGTSGNNAEIFNVMPNTPSVNHQDSRRGEVDARRPPLCQMEMDTLTNMSHLAEIYWHRGLWDEAVKLQELRLEISMKISEEQPSTLTPTEWNHGVEDSWDFRL